MARSREVAQQRSSSVALDSSSVQSPKVRLGRYATVYPSPPPAPAPVPAYPRDSLLTRQLKEGDVVGIALDFTDLPMLFFTCGGAPLGQGDELAVMRIRGTVYPAVGVGGGAAVTLTFADRSLAHRPPRKCQALVVGQDMM